MEQTLIFVYNANSGVFNALADWAHKIISPSTYACRLCALTYSNIGMRKEWRAFVDGLGCAVEFLHADELQKKYGVVGLPLPAIFSKNKSVEMWATADELNSCDSLDALQQLVLRKLSK